MRRRKNFLPTLILAILFWLSWLYIIFFTSPENTTYYVPHTTYFFLALSFALILTLSLIFANTRRGFLTTLGIISFLILRMLNSAHYLNLALLAGILFSVELYLTKK